MNTFNMQLARHRTADLRSAAEHDRMIRQCATRLREQRRELRRQRREARREERRCAAQSWAWDFTPIDIRVMW